MPTGPGELTRRVRLVAGGRYRVWVGGSFARSVRVSVDGKSVGSVSYEAGNPGQYFALGRVPLGPGTHRITISRAGGDLRPGDAGSWRGSLVFVTPVVLSPDANERLEVQTIASARAAELCRLRLDWIEAVGGR